MNQRRFIAIDWGTTNRRIFLIEDGQVVLTLRDAKGVSAIAQGDFAGLAHDARREFGDYPMLLAGMVGSNRGWMDAGYVSAPARIEDLARSLAWVDARTAIVPGVSRRDDERADVMRGEEVQMLGAVAARLVPEEALLCQPGTHCKWARISGGALVDFITAMTGEMFALLKAHALIGMDMLGDACVGEAFRAGVIQSARGDLLGSLFSARPAVLLGVRPREETAAFVSGLLIGADCHAHGGKGVVHLLADPALTALYSAAIEQIGGKAVPVDSHAAFVAGICHIWELME